MAHGLGRLTKRQQRDVTNTLNKLSDAGLRVINDKVELDEDILDTVGKQCASFIESIDVAVSERDDSYR